MSGSLLNQYLTSGEWLEGLVVSEWKSIKDRSWKAEFTLTFRCGLILRKCRYFINPTDQWVRAPQRPLNDGTGQFDDLVMFETTALHKKFIREALKAIRLYSEDRDHGL